MSIAIQPLSAALTTATLNYNVSLLVFAFKVINDVNEI